LGFEEAARQGLVLVECACHQRDVGAFRRKSFGDACADSAARACLTKVSGVMPEA
jgi:hypothetical protein